MQLRADHKFAELNVTFTCYLALNVICCPARRRQLATIMRVGSETGGI